MIPQLFRLSVLTEISLIFLSHYMVFDVNYI